MSAIIQEVNARESVLVSLRKRWLTLILLQGLLILVSYYLLVNWWSSQFAFRWAVLATLFTVYFMRLLWRNLIFNFRPDQRMLLKKFGPGNLLTILRGFLLAFLFGFLFSPWSPGWLAWIPGFLYTFAALADLFDGYLARKFDHETLLGKELDLSLDGLGLLIASILLVQYGQVPIWYLLVGLARYLFLFGIWFRRKRGKPVYEMKENSTRRPFAGAQMGFVAVILFPLFTPPGTYLAAALFALPFLIGFSIDWLGVSGVSLAGIFRGSNKLAKPEKINKHVLPLWEKVISIVTRWLPLIVRASLVIMLIVWLDQNLSGLIPHQFYSVTNSISATTLSGFWLGLTLILAMVSLLLIAMGAAGRLASIFLLFGIGIYQNYFGLYFSEILLVAGASALFYLGSGPYSLWKPERDIIAKRLGEM